MFSIQSILIQEKLMEQLERDKLSESLLAQILLTVTSQG